MMATLTSALVLRLLIAAGAAPAGTLSPAFTIEVPETSAPFISANGDAIIVATRAGQLTAYPVMGGSATWKTDLGSGVSEAPVLAGSRIVVATRAGTVILLDPSDGREIARAAAGGEGLMLAASAAGLVISDPAGSVSLMDPATGSLAWTAHLRSSPSVRATQCGSSLLVGTSAGELVSLSAAGGMIEWCRKIGGPITTPVLCDKRLAWVGSSDNRLYSVSLRRRGFHRRWSYESGADVSGTPILFSGRLLFFSFDTYLYALESGNGHLAWKVRLARRPQPESIIVDSMLIVASLNAERMEAFHLPDGAQAATLPLASGSERVVTPPVRAGRLLVVGAARYGEQTSRVLGVDASSIVVPDSAAREDSAPVSPRKRHHPSRK